MHEKATDAFGVGPAFRLVWASKRRVCGADSAVFRAFSCLIFALECGFLIAENGGAGQETVSWKVLLENGRFGVMRWFIAVSVLLCRWVESGSI